MTMVPTADPKTLTAEREDAQHQMDDIIRRLGEISDVDGNVRPPHVAEGERLRAQEEAQRNRRDYADRQLRKLP
jgi:hypothetical protein